MSLGVNLLAELARKAAAVRMVLDQKMTYREAAEAVGISKSTLTRAVRAEKARRSIF